MISFRVIFTVFVLLFLFISSVSGQILLDENSKIEAERLREEVKSLSTESDRVKYLISYVEDKKSLLPEYAVSLLGALKSKESVPFLNSILQSKEERYSRIKEFIPQILANLSDKRSIEPLIEALSDKNLVVAKRSAIALTLINKHNPGVKFEVFDQNQEEAVRLWQEWWHKNKEVIEINEKKEDQTKKTIQSGKENK